MSKKLLSLSVFTIALAVAFVFWAPNGTKAASDNYNEPYVGSNDSFGVDEADNGVGPLDRDKDRDKDKDGAIKPPLFQPYGLQGNWRDQR